MRIPCRSERTKREVEHNVVDESSKVLQLSQFLIRLCKNRTRVRKVITESTSSQMVIESVVDAVKVVVKWKI